MVEVDEGDPDVTGTQGPRRDVGAHVVGQRRLGRRLLGQSARFGQQPAQTRLIAADAGLVAARTGDDIRLIQHHQAGTGADLPGRLNLAQLRRIGAE